MSLANSAGEKILGMPIEEIPEGCRECPVLHEFAAKYPEIDLTHRPLYPDRAATMQKVADMVFSRMGNMCPRGVTETGECGSKA